MNSLSKRLGGDVADLEARVVLEHVLRDGLEEVRLAQSGGAVDEQRVVGPARRLGHRQRRRLREAVRGAGHERVEGVLRIDVGGSIAGRRRERLGGGRDRSEADALAGEVDEGLVEIVHRQVELVLDADLEAQAVVAPVRQRSEDELPVALVDPVLDELGRNLDRQAVLVEVQTPDVLEGGGVDAVGHLLCEDRRRSLPDDLRITDHRHRLPAPRTSTEPSTECGQLSHVHTGVRPPDGGAGFRRRPLAPLRERHHIKGRRGFPQVDDARDSDREASPRGERAHYHVRLRLARATARALFSSVVRPLTWSGPAASCIVPNSLRDRARIIGPGIARRLIV